MQSTEKLWLSKEEQWIRKAMISNGIAAHCTDMAKLGFAKAKRGRDGQRNGKEEM